MSFQDFMAKVRHWDNVCARWMMRHFYIIFFEFVLVAIFFIFLFNTLATLELGDQVSQNLTERLLFQQTVHSLIIIVLLILNSFWLLYMFHGLNSLRSLLKDISFNTMRARQKDS